MTIAPAEKPALRQATTADAEAYEFYLRGRQLFYRGGLENTKQAREMFYRAIELDGSYAVAYAGVADCCSFLYLYYEPTEENLQQADTCSCRVLQLNPELAEGHAARGLALSLLEKDEAAEIAFETAIAKNPRLFEAYYLYGRTSYVTGKLEKAAQLFERAHEVRSDDFQSVYLLGKVYRGLGRRGKAEAANRLALQLAEQQLELNPNHARARVVGACCLVELGAREKGLSWAEQASHTADPLLYYVVCCYARAGGTRQALDCLERVINGGWSHRRWLDVDHDLDELRTEPRFQELAKRIA